MPFRLACSETGISCRKPGGAMMPPSFNPDDIPASINRELVAVEVQLTCTRRRLVSAYPDAGPFGPLAASGATVGVPLAIQFEPAFRQPLASRVIAEPSHQDWWA